MNKTVGIALGCGGLLIVGLVVAAIAGFLVYRYMTPLESTANTPNDKPTNSSRSPEAEKQPAGTLSAYELAKKHAASKDSVSQYNGKEITIRGYIMIKPTITDPKDGGLLSVGEDSDKFDDAIGNDILCWIDAADVPSFKSLKGDQYVTVKGIFSGNYNAELKFCKLVNAE
jgi:hypothetical protein